MLPSRTFLFDSTRNMRVASELSITRTRAAFCLFCVDRTMDSTRGVDSTRDLERIRAETEQTTSSTQIREESLLSIPIYRCCSPFYPRYSPFYPCYSSLTIPVRLLRLVQEVSNNHQSERPRRRGARPRYGDESDTFGTVGRRYRLVMRCLRRHF